MKLELVQFPDQILISRAEPVTEFDERLRELAHAMLDLMYDNKGVGIAAPQVGVSRRLLVMDWVAGDPDDLFGRSQILINPRITHRSTELEVGPEGCLSIPGVTVQVARHKSIEVEFQTLDGGIKSAKAVDFPARILQHEIDHLDGTVMIEAAQNLSRPSTSLLTV